MKLILIHGSFQDAALKKVSTIKKEFEKLSISEVSESSGGSLNSPGLFAGKRLVIFENPSSKTVEEIIIEKDPDLTVLIKFSKNLEKASPILKLVQEAGGEILVFNEMNESSIFPLLDMLGTKNKNSFKEFEKKYSEFGGQYLLTMLAYFLRRMIQKPKSGSDFMRQKIETQKRNFSIKRIEALYKEIIETDFKIKQGFTEEKFAVTMLIQKILN